MREAPWSNQKVLQLPDKTERLALEILQFQEYISPTYEEDRERIGVQQVFEQFVEYTLPGLTFDCFGSHVTGLMLPGSDMDVALVSESVDITAKALLKRMMNALLKARLCSFKEITFVPWAKVPVMTIDSPRYGITVDITANNLPKSSLRTSRWLIEYPELKPLYMVLKHSLLSLRHPQLQFTPMSAKSSGLASFSLVCLIVHFLSVEAEKQGCSRSSTSYYAELLIEFLDFYSNFDFDSTGIQFSKSKPYFKKDYHPRLYIIDPDDRDNNIGKSTSKIGELKECFAFLLKTLLNNRDDGPSNSILQRIIPVDQQLPINGTKRLEGRQYVIQPLYMAESEIVNKQEMALQVKRGLRKERRQQKQKQGKESVYDDDHLNPYFGSSNYGDANNHKDSKKRKRKNPDGDDTSSNGYNGTMHKKKSTIAKHKGKGKGKGKHAVSIGYIAL